MEDGNSESDAELDAVLGRMKTQTNTRRKASTTVTQIWSVKKGKI